MQPKAFLWTALLVAGCKLGAPAGFSRGDHWTLPLVGPLENGRLITAVTVRGHGPYLFAIDPDAKVSAIDQQVVDEAVLDAGNGPAQIDEAGSEQNRRFTELVDLKLGDLTVSKRLVMLVPSGFYDLEGRRVNGVLARDVLGDLMVFGFDRDQGIAMLSVPTAFTPPPGAIALPYKSVDPALQELALVDQSVTLDSTNHDDASRVGVITRTGTPLDAHPTARQVVVAQVGAASLKLHVDLGEAVGQLREPLWRTAGLAPAEVKLRLVDDVASVREVSQAGTAVNASVGAVQARATFAPYVDKRYPLGKIDGSLGLDFLQSYAVYVNWEDHNLYLKPRGDAAATTTARLGRWGTAIPHCAHPGCATANIVPTEVGSRLDIVRDPEAAGHPLEVRFAATMAGGKPAPPPLTVELPAGADQISGALPQDYEGATFTLVDASPFTRPCADDKGCVIQADAAPAP